MTLANSVDWQPNDELFLVDDYQFEISLVKSVTNNQVTLQQPLRLNHTFTVSHITRNVIFSSQLSANESLYHAHFMVMMNTSVLVQNARFNELGRTTTDWLQDTLRDVNGTYIFFSLLRIY